MKHQTAQDTKDWYIESMGPDLGQLFYLLKQDLLQLYAQWNEYVGAFGTNKERIDLLNRAAGGFARAVQDALWANVLLGLTRLTDPPMSAGKTNLTITQIPELLEGNFKILVQKLVDTAVGSTGFARDWRNRHLAHRDLSHAMDSSATPLEKASRLKVREALEAIVVVMNQVAQKFECPSTVYSETRNENGVLELLDVIKHGLRLRQERCAQRKVGKPLSADYVQRTI